MNLRLLFLAGFIATTSSSCTLSPNSADKVAAGITHVPVEGKVGIISRADLAAAVRTLGTRSVYRLNIVDRDYIVAAVQSANAETAIEITRVNGQWRRGHEVVITP